MAVSQTLTLTQTGTVDNTSYVKIEWKSTQSGNSYNDYTRTGYYYVSINGGAEQKYTITYTLPYGKTVVLVSDHIEVPHRPDGTATVMVRTWMDTSITAGVIEKSQRLVLTPIVKASTITSVANRTLGEACSVTWTPLSTSYTYKLTFSLGSWQYITGAIKPNTTSPYTYTGYTLPLAVANQLPNASTGTMQVSLATFVDANATTQAGVKSTQTFTITVPNNEQTQPEVIMSISPYSTLPSPYNSVYIQGLSKVKATLGFTTKYGTTIVASNITVNGNTYSDPYESGFLTQGGTVSVKATVKDSRGYYGTNYEDIEVIPYEKPYIQAYSGESSIIVARCDQSANFTDSGTYLKIKAKIVFSKVIINGVQKNYGNIKFRYRKEGGAYSAWQTILNCKTDNSDEVITAPLLNGALDIQSNYQVQIIASDDFYDSALITIAVPSDAVYMHRPAGGKSMGLGGYSSGDGKLDIYWNVMARGGISLFDSKGDEIPLGSTMPIPRNQIAEGWNPDQLDCGVYVVAKSIGLKSGDTVIMYNGVLIQMAGDAGGNVKIQLALPVDEGRSPMYRVCWYGTWSTWRSMKL